MKLLAWNSQGLGGALTANQLKEFCRIHSPQLVFLSETKNQFCRVDFIRKFVGMDCSQIVNPVGTAGGLAVLWKSDLKVSIIHSSSFFVDVLITDDESGKAWHLINVYASSIDTIRRTQWAELIQYRRNHTGDWVIWGDFNDLCGRMRSKGVD